MHGAKMEDIRETADAWDEICRLNKEQPNDTASSASDDDEDEDMDDEDDDESGSEGDSEDDEDEDDSMSGIRLATFKGLDSEVEVGSLEAIGPSFSGG